MFMTSERETMLRLIIATCSLVLFLGAGRSVAAAAAPPDIKIQAIVPVKLFYACKAEIGAVINSPPASAEKSGCVLQQALNEHAQRPTLIGAGDVVIAVTGDSWQEPDIGAKLHVWLNGADVTDDITVAGAERLDKTVYLTLRLNPGKQSRGLWATLIHDAGMTTPVPLWGAPRWPGVPPPSPRADIPSALRFPPKTAVTTTERLWVAFALIAVFGIGAIVLAVRRGVLRDKPVDPIGKLFSQADQLRRLWTRRHTSMDPCIRNFYPAYKPNVPGSPDYLPCLPDNVDPACLEAADKALDSALIPANTAPVVIGIIQGRRTWSYSLAATQLFAWFLFALLAGIYVWTVYGQLPAIEGSVLGLLGISVGTAGLSWVIDTNPLRRNGGPSSGFFADLISDPDNASRIHRFQCVFVNGALLLVGIANVVFDVTYPTFDPSWLIFLAISGVTYTGGKQLKET